MSNDAMDRLLEVLCFTPTDFGWGSPGMFWGLPGVAKTYKVRQFAQRFNAPLQVLSPAQMGEGAFGVTGMPFGAGKNMRIGYPAPLWTQQFVDEEDGPIAGIVFIDEISSTPPALHGPLLALLQEKRIGDHYLGDHVRIIAAGNPPDVAASGWDLPAPVANRMPHYDWQAPSQAQWAAYMMGKFNSDGTKTQREEKQSFATTEKLVRDGWANAYPRIVGLTTAFTKANAQCFYAMPKVDDPAASKAWPSLRTWDGAVCAMTTATILGRTEAELIALLAGYVGHGAAIEFATYRLRVDLPDPEDLLDGKIAFTHDPNRIDRSMAVLSSCAALVAPQGAKDRERRANALWKLIETSLSVAMDLGVPAAQILCSPNVGLMALDNAKRPLITLRPVIQAAGF